MNKMVLSLSLVLSLVSIASFAGTPCQNLAEEAVLHFADSATPNTPWEIISSQLIKKSDSALLYEVAAYASSSDGASTVDFPDTTFVVKAKGTEAQCKITGIREK